MSHLLIPDTFDPRVVSVVWTLAVLVTFFVTVAANKLVGTLAVFLTVCLLSAVGTRTVWTRLAVVWVTYCVWVRR